MSKKARAYSLSKLGLEKPDNRKAFYAGWEAKEFEPRRITNEEIAAEFDRFFEFDTEDRSLVTSVSCRLFALHIARLQAKQAKNEGESCS
jgi:hypothetical protein